MRYLELGGPPERFTFSSDAQTPGGACAKLYREFVACVRKHRLAIDRALPHFTRNAADALRLCHKGRIKPGADADLLVIDKDTLDVRHVVARGALLMRDGSVLPRNGSSGSFDKNTCRKQGTAT
jgi:beta-aspartyl-dipeptidase (metallo-type)